MEFPPTPSSVRDARRFVSDVLGSAVDDEVVGRVLLAASELATNAVEHAATPFVVDVELSGEIVRVAVSDASSAQPVVRDAAIHDVGGRGLSLVSKLSTRWGVDDRGHQKTVWCEIPVAPPSG